MKLEVFFDTFPWKGYFPVELDQQSRLFSMKRRVFSSWKKKHFSSVPLALNLSCKNTAPPAATHVLRESLFSSFGCPWHSLPVHLIFYFALLVHTPLFFSKPLTHAVRLTKRFYVYCNEKRIWKTGLEKRGKERYTDTDSEWSTCIAKKRLTFQPFIRAWDASLLLYSSCCLSCR